MYKSSSFTQAGAIDLNKHRVFIPDLVAYQIHTIHITPQGGLKQSEEIDFEVTTPFANWLDMAIAAALRLSDSCLVEIDYFYKNSKHDPNSISISKKIVSDTNSNPTTPDEASSLAKRSEIFLSHYIDAMFSLDSGLYKESVINFGTVVEVLLNTELKKIRLVDLINNSSLVTSMTQELHNVRELRNRVHPKVISDYADVSRKDALNCRNTINKFITAFAKHSNY